MMQIKSFMVMNVGEYDRVSITYEEIDQMGNPSGKNNKSSFYALDDELEEHIKAIRDILKKRLEG